MATNIFANYFKALEDNIHQVDSQSEDELWTTFLQINVSKTLVLNSII